MQHGPYNKWIVCIRIILTLAMIYMAYTETGIWTAGCFLFCFFGLECAGYLLHIQKPIEQKFDIMKALNLLDKAVLSTNKTVHVDQKDCE